jgi:Protein of unknown function (DUF2934)
MNYNDSEVHHKNVERVAYRLWEERGRPDGSPEEDWLRAELEVQAIEVGLPITAVAATISRQ